MKVSELAAATGVSVHRLRRYEEMGLLQAARSPSGYREFAPRAVREVVFLSMARDLGFSFAQLQEWLPRYRAGTLALDDLREEFERRILEVDGEIAARRALRRKLVDHIAWVRRRQVAAKRMATRPKRMLTPFDVVKRRAT